jgi:class 3 adenylate cyclase
LLEREHDLARAGELVEAAVAGESRLALIEGPAGAGKTAILRTLALRAEDQGMRVLRATGLELEHDYSFGVVRQVFEPALYELDKADRTSVFAGAARPAEELLVGRGVDAGPALADPGFTLLHSLYWALVGLTDLRPVALVVDDAQWADALSLRFLAFVLKRSEGLRLMVALARRDGPEVEQSDALTAVMSAPATVIRLAPLTGAAISLLLSEAIGEHLDADTVAEAERLTEGNPLYVRELADSLTSGLDTADDPMARLRGAAPAAVARRAQTELARLDEDAQGLARATAILGEDVPLREAAALAEVDMDHSGTAADALVRARILLVGEPLRFRHPLVREAVLESIQPRARAAAHGRAARLLVNAGEPPERAAIHLLQSDPGGDPEVVGTLRRAAARTAVRAVPELAISVLKRALLEPPEPAHRPLILNELALVEARVGNPEAYGHFEEAFASASSLKEMTAGASVYAALLGAVRGKFGEAEALIDRVLDAIDNREAGLILEAELFAWTLWTSAASERLSRVSLGLAGATPGERLVLALRACDAAAAGTVSAAQAAPMVRAALRDGVGLTELGPDSPICWRQIQGLSEMDDLGSAEDELAAAIEEARRVGSTVGLAVLLIFRGVLAGRRGQLSAGESDARTAVEILAQMGYLAGQGSALGTLISFLTEGGKFDEAEALLSKHNFAGPVPEGPGYHLLEQRGWLRLSQGRTAEAIDDLNELRRRLDAGAQRTTPLLAYLTRWVPALVQTGHETEARTIAEEALPQAQASGSPRFVASARRAHALATTGQPDIAELEAAAEIFEGIGATLELARTLLDIGTSLRHQHQPAAAREPLRRALDLARKCGARPIAERAEHELRASGGRPRRDRITGRDALTATEQRVAQLAIDGMTNRQIAETLFVTRKTIESHLDHIFHKLGIHTRGELKPALAGDQTPRARNDDGPPTERVQRAFMFTDIVDSTPLVSALGDEAWIRLLQWHDRTLRELFGSHGGQEVHHNGDGFFVAFEQAEAAVRCAEEIQRRLEHHRRENGFAPQVRIGVHLDAANHLAGDYLGQGVHLAARIGAQAQGGEVLVSRATLKGVASHLNLGRPRTTQLRGFNNSIELVPVIWT